MHPGTCRRDLGSSLQPDCLSVLSEFEAILLLRKQVLICGSPTFQGLQTYMLIDEYYPDVLSLFRELVERLFYGRLLRLVVDYKEIPLRVWRLCDMSNACQEKASNRAGSRQDLTAGVVVEHSFEVGDGTT